MRCSPKIVLALAGVATAAWLPSLAQTVPPGGWDVDFNGDTPGNPPATVPYNDSIVNTTPNSIDANAGNSVLVQSALGALTDQPLVIDVTAPQSGFPSVQFGFDSTPAPNQSHNTYEFDLLVDSTTAPAGGTKIFSVRLLQSAGQLVNGLTIRNQDTGGGELDLLPEFVGSWDTWDSNFNDFFVGTAINLRAELDRNANTITWYMNDNLFLVGSDADIDKIGTIQFRDAAGFGGNAQPVVLGIDNFISPVPSPDVSIAQFSVADTPTVQYLSEAGVTYSLESSTDGDFSPAGAVQTGDGSMQSIFDPSGLDTGKTYRVIAWP
jgi:hypothetical protein